MAHSEFLATALEAARAGAAVIRRYYQRNLQVTLKADKSPVTQADVETEQAIRSIIGGSFPPQGGCGGGNSQSSLGAGCLWAVGPARRTERFGRERALLAAPTPPTHARTT